jgi:hypothetical protein
MHLAHQFKSDFLKLRFTDEANPPRLFGTDGVDRDGSSFWRSLTYALLAAASDVIDIDRWSSMGFSVLLKMTTIVRRLSSMTMLLPELVIARR